MTFRAIKVVTLFCLCLPGILSAAEGVSGTEVRFAQIAQTDGEFGTFARAYQAGILAAFDVANQEGGVHGRMVQLDSYDDGGEPEGTVENVRRILRDDDHLGFVGVTTGAGARAIQPLLKKAKIPFIAPLSGDEELRVMAMSHVRNLRPSLQQEAEAWICHLVDEEGLEKVAVFYQNDLVGRQGAQAISEALQARGLEIHTRSRYPRNTRAVKVALLKIRRERPQAVILLGEHAPVVGFIETAKMMEFDPIFVLGSSVSREAIWQGLGEDAAGLIVTHLCSRRLIPTSPWQTPTEARSRAARSSGLYPLKGIWPGAMCWKFLRRLARRWIAPPIERECVLSVPWTWMVWSWSSALATIKVWTVSTSPGFGPTEVLNRFDSATLGIGK